MLSIRAATIDDVLLLNTLVHELANYDRVGHEAVVTEEDLARDGFGSHPKFRAVIAEWDGRVAGYVIVFSSFIPRFKAGAGLFLDDIFVRRNFEKRALVGRCLTMWPGSPGTRNTSACVGKFWTGTHPLLSFIGV